MTLESWNNVSTAADLYISIITGAKLADTESAPPLKTMMMSMMVNGPAVAKYAEPLPDVKSMAAVADGAMQGIGRTMCREIFSAPAVRGAYPRRSELDIIVNEYSRAASNLR